MSDFDDFDADFNQDFADAEETNGRLVLWLLGGGAVVALVVLALCAGSVWMAAGRIGDFPLFDEFAQAEMPPPLQETTDERRAWARRVFSDSPPFEFDRRPIETLFRRVEEACSDGDHAAFRRLIDQDRYWRSMKESGLIDGLTRADDRRYAADVVTLLEVPGGYDRLHVQSVTKGPHPLPGRFLLSRSNYACMLMPIG